MRRESIYVANQDTGLLCDLFKCGLCIAVYLARCSDIGTGKQQFGVTHCLHIEPMTLAVSVEIVILAGDARCVGER